MWQLLGTVLSSVLGGGGGKGADKTNLIGGAVDKGLNQPNQIGPGAGMQQGLGVGEQGSTPAMSIGGAQSADLSGQLTQQAKDAPPSTAKTPQAQSGNSMQDIAGLIMAARGGGGQQPHSAPNIPESQPVAGQGAAGGMSILDTLLAIISGGGQPPASNGTIGGVRP